MPRYIDAEKLKEKKYYSTTRHEYCVSVADIDWQPTADVQGVKHGEWIIENFEPDYADINRYKLLIQCSNCGLRHFLGTTKYKNDFTKDDLKAFKGSFSWCGKCGAKMDKI